MARIFLITLLSSITISVSAQEDMMKVFNHLLNKTWKVEGSWGGAMEFKQEVTFTAALEGNLVIAETKGFVDEKQTQWGHRNHGIRRYDAQEEKIKFFEYDVFGGLTQGEIQLNGKNLLYVYEYGGQMICDKWEFVNENEYKYIVGSFKDGQIDQVLMEAKAVAK